MNYYEVLILDREGELEVLGWGFAYENISGILLCAFILSLSCFVVVVITLNARRLRALLTDNTMLSGYLEKRHFKFLTQKVQNFWEQEVGSVGVIRRITKVFHNRRV